MIIRPYDYDRAFVKKMKAVFSNFVYATPDNALAQAALDFEDKDSDKDGIYFPLINGYRVTWSLDSSFYNEMSFRHGRYAINTSEIDGQNMVTLPISLTYSLDIWSPDSDTVDYLATELIFFFFHHPNLILELEKPWPASFKECKISINDVVENSDFNSKFVSGPLYRTTFDLLVSNATIATTRDFKRVTSIPVKYGTYTVTNPTLENDKD